MAVNKVILIGNVGGDPEMKFPDKNSCFATFSLATSEMRGTGGTEVTDWHRIVLSGEAARFAERYIRKGTHLFVEGRLKYREYEDKYKIRRKIAEIIADKFEILGRNS